MTKLTALLVVGTLALGTAALVGCHEQQQPESQPNATAGGNGTFGENPAQPGEHSGEHFNNSSPTTQPGQ